MYSASNILAKARTYYIPSGHRSKRTKVLWGAKKHRFYHADREYYRNVYLKSNHWKELRQKKLQENPVCEDCGSNNRVEPHHLNYKSLYNVDLTDLKTLCRVCHNKAHKDINERNIRLNNKKSNKEARRERRTYIRWLSNMTGLSKQVIQKSITQKEFLLALKH